MKGVKTPADFRRAVTALLSDVIDGRVSAEDVAEFMQGPEMRKELKKWATLAKQ